MKLAAEAYEAYRQHTGGKSLATGQPIPTWDHLPRPIQLAWEVSTAWVCGRITAQGVHADRLFTENCRLEREKAALLDAAKKGLYLGEIAVRLGLSGFSKRDEDAIIRDHVDLKMIREAIARATAQEAA